MRLRIFIQYSLLCASIFLSACGGGNSNPAPAPNPGPTSNRGDLITVTNLGAISIQTIDLAFDTYGAPTFTAAYAAINYKIVYKTVDTAGNLVNASGLLSIPQKDAAIPSAVLLYQHGTIFNEQEAPTNSTYRQTLSAMLASQDYIVAMPDYLGYGEATNLLHPYLHASSLASASIDMLRASKAFLVQQSISLSSKLFVTGYSEGGYAAMAVHREIQTTHASEFVVTAAVPASGPYDLTATADYYLTSITSPYAPNIAFAVKAYDTVYGWGRMHDFFQTAPIDYANIVDNYFYGNYTGLQIDSALPDMTADLFHPNFISSFLGAGESVVKAKLAENNVYNWQPVAPVRLFHGDADPIVPDTNAYTALAAMSAMSNDVAIESCGGDHNSCFVPYLIYMMSWFATI